MTAWGFGPFSCAPRLVAEGATKEELLLAIDQLEDNS
jgi:hypothetical protein